MTRATKRRGQRATASEPADERPRFRVIADTLIRGSVWHAGKDFTGELPSGVRLNALEPEGWRPVNDSAKAVDEYARIYRGKGLPDRASVDDAPALCRPDRAEQLLSFGGGAFPQMETKFD
jgi:hypothetical protein